MRAASRQRTRQWSRAAWALAALFASLPVSSRLFLGVWGFDTAAEVAFLFVVLGSYLHILSRRTSGFVPDPAEMLQQALQTAGTGDLDEAGRILTEAIRLSPRFWQAYQIRGGIALSRNLPKEALQDFNQAIAIEPNDPHLYMLRANAFYQLGDQAAAARDGETAAGLIGIPEPPA